MRLQNKPVLQLIFQIGYLYRKKFMFINNKRSYKYFPPNFSGDTIDILDNSVHSIICNVTQYKVTVILSVLLFAFRLTKHGKFGKTSF